jgi:hypothetical protein
MNSHLIQYFNQLGINFNVIPGIGLSFLQSEYSYDVFNKFENRIYSLDQTFIISFIK